MQYSLKFVSIFVSIVLVSSVAQAGHSHTHIEGYDAYLNKDYVTAYNIWKELAETGNPNAQYNLGMLYTEGNGTPKNEEKSFYWFLLAAEAGNAQAQLIIATRYSKGIGIKPDPVKAYKWILISRITFANSRQDREATNADLDNIIRIISQNMTPEELERATIASRNWRPH